MTKQLKLQASAIYRHQECPGSAHLLRELDSDLHYRPFKDAASFGRDIHDIAERILKAGVAGQKEKTIPALLKEYGYQKGTADYNKGLNAVTHYKKHFVKIMKKHQKYKGETTILIEEKYRTTIHNVDCVAKCDSAIITIIQETGEAYLDFFDLKTGNYDYIISATEQLFFSALLWVQKHLIYDKITHITAHTVQPNYYNSAAKIVPISFEPDRSSVLRAILKDMVVGIQTASNTFDPGDHCKMCPAILTCPKMQDYVETMKIFIASTPEPVNISRSVLEAIWLHKNQIESFLKAVTDVIKDDIEAGEHFDNISTKQTSGQRTWVDAKKAEKKFKKMFGDEIYEKKLKTPAQIEKLAGKEEVADMVTTPRYTQLTERENPFDKI